MIEAIIGALELPFILNTLFGGRTEMPVAVVVAENKRFDLKTAPPDGYVVIRQMSYGEKIQRTGMTGAMKLLKQTAHSDVIGELSMATENITLWDFANLVVEHNMQDQDGRNLDFKNAVDVRKLTSVVGDEIGTYIDEYNNFEADEDLGN
jgi:hypothetical protein